MTSWRAEIFGLAGRSVSYVRAGHWESGPRPGRWLHCRAGTSAVEFSLFAPMLAASLVLAADLGLVLGERMTVDHVLRAGAQSALLDPGTATVDSVMQGTGEANFTIGDGGDALALSSDRFCACPDSTSVEVVCSTICPGTLPPFTYYRMSAQTSYTGWILGPLALARTIQVQVR